MSINERLKLLRSEKGYNMRQLSIALNMPYTTYVNYEKGTREMNSEILVLISKFFGVSIDYLLGLTEEREPTEPKAPEPNDIHADDDAFVLEKYKRLSIPNQFETLKYMDWLFEEQQAEEKSTERRII